MTCLPPNRTSLRFVLFIVDRGMPFNIMLFSPMGCLRCSLMVQCLLSGSYAARRWGGQISAMGRFRPSVPIGQSLGGLRRGPWRMAPSGFVLGVYGGSGPTSRAKDAPSGARGGAACLCGVFGVLRIFLAVARVSRSGLWSACFRSASMAKQMQKAYQVGGL